MTATIITPIGQSNLKGTVISMNRNRLRVLIAGKKMWFNFRNIRIETRGDFENSEESYFRNHSAFN